MDSNEEVCMTKLDHAVPKGLKGPARLAGRALLASETPVEGALLHKQSLGRGKGGRHTHEIGPQRGRAREVAGGRRESRRFANGAPDPDRARLERICRHEGFYSGTTRYDHRSRVLRFVLVCEGCGTEMREVRRVAYSPQYEPCQARPLAA
jgi:hypothetical protein